MFTGIITGIGRVRAVQPIGQSQAMRLEIETPTSHPDWTDAASIPIGASIACSGCCLSAVAVGVDWFAVEVSAETLMRTTLGHWKLGTPVNLERPLRVGAELGGHIVLGHVDGVAKTIASVAEQGSIRFAFKVPRPLARFVAPKGSIAIDGVSLTINEVEETLFGVNVIPHTQAETTLGRLADGDLVNFEADMLARYVARLKEVDAWKS